MVGTNEIRPVLQAADALMDTRQALKASSQSGMNVKEHITQAGGMTLNGVKTLTAEQKQAKQALEKEAKSYQPTIADKAVGVAGTASGLVGVLSFFGLGAVNLLGKTIGWTGKVLKFSSIQKAGEKISAPANWLNTNDFTALGNKLKIAEPMGRVSQVVANGAAWVTEKAGAQSIVGSRMQGMAIGNAHRHFLKAKAHAEALDLGQIPAEHRPHFEVLHEAITNSGHVGDLHHYVAGHEKLKFKTPVAAAVEGAAVSTAVKSETVTMAAALKNAEAAATTMAKKGGGVDKATLKAVNRFLGATEKTTNALNNAKGWGNIAGAIRSVPGKLAKAPIAHTMMNGAFVAGSAVSMAGDALSAKTQLHMLKEMCADMMGKNIDNISTAKVLFGSVPEPVRKARGALVKQLLMKEGADAVNVVINTKQALNAKFSMAKAMVGFLGAEAVSSAADRLVADHTAEAYVGFKQAQLAAKASGQQLTGEQYTQFVGMVSPDLERRGGARSRFAQEIGKQYAQEQKSAAEIMREIESGKLLARVHGIIDETSRHAAQVIGANTRMQKPVVGQHSQKVVSEAVDHGVGRI